MGLTELPELSKIAISKREHSMTSNDDYSPYSDQDLDPMTENQTLSLNSLIAVLVGSMVGSEVFTLPAGFGRATMRSHWL
jgi:hypothetical protein